MNLFSEISARGYLDSTTHPELVSILNEKKICFYVGFDPSADSFHLGQLAVFRLMALLQKALLRLVLLVQEYSRFLPSLLECYPL